METKQEAITYIRSLMQKHQISLNELANFPSTHPQKMNNIKIFFAFLSGIFILSGISIYMAQEWAAMNSAARIIITLGVGFAFYIFAVITSSNNQYEKMLTPLFLLAVAFETLGLFVTFSELFSYQSNWHIPSLIIFGTMFLQQLLTFTKYERTSLLLFTIIFGALFFMTLMDYCKINEYFIEMTMGLSLFLITYRISYSKYSSLSPFWYLISSMVFLSGFFSFVKGTKVELLYLGVSVLVIYLSTILRSRTLLFSGTISLIAYIGYFTSQHFANSIGWPLALILFGVLLILISSLSIKIGKKIKL